MLRKLFAIVVCGMYLSGSSVSVLPRISYFLNKNYIAHNLCENKGNISMHCEGRCYLAKEIKELTEKQQGRNQPQTNQQQYEMFPHMQNEVFVMRSFHTVSNLTPLDINIPTTAQSVFRALQPPEWIG